MNDFIKLLLSLSLSGSLLALLLFAVKPFIRGKVSKTFQYYIWLLVLLRLVFPFSLETSLMNSLFFASHPEGNASISSTAANSTVTNSEGVVQSDTSQAYAENPQASSLTVGQKANAGYYNNDPDHAAYLNDLLAQALIGIWLLGVLAALTYHVSGYLRFLHRLKPANVTVSEQEFELLQAQVNAMFHRQKRIRLFRNRYSSTPMLIGLFSPSIVIPDQPFTTVQLESILRHELTHLKRGDLIIKWFAVIVTSFHWFNPLLILVKREMNRACELSCDESVISGLDRDQRQAYGETLIAVVAERRYPVGVLSTTMCEEKRTLKERLAAIMNYSRGTQMMVLLSAVLLAVLLGACTVLGAGVGRDPSGSPAGKSGETAAGNTAQRNAPDNISISAGNKAGAKTGTLLTSADYDFTGISQHKTPYVGNHSKDLSLVASLPLPDTYFIQQYISLRTKEEPYGLTVYYEAAGNAAYPGEWPVLTAGTKLEVNSKLNALVLFAMIGNVSDISFAYRGTKSFGSLEMDKYDTVFSFSRKEIEDDIGSLTGLSKDPEWLADVFDKAAAKWVINIASPESPEQIKEKIDKALTVIMTPASSSNPGDYIRAHQTEYDEIVKMGGLALPYLKGILDSGDGGLRGNIVEQLYKDIKGGSGITEVSPQTDTAVLPEYSDEEVASARAVVEKFYKGIAEKDAEAVLSTLYPREGQSPEKTKEGYALSFDRVNRSLVSVTYDSQDPIRKTYRPGNLKITSDNIIVFRTSFDIEYHGKADGSWNEGRYDNWAMILIRNDAKSPWLIYDQGY